MYGAPPEDIWETEKNRYLVSNISNSLIDLRRYVRYIGVLHKMKIQKKIGINKAQVSTLFETN